jgi:trans-aconitate 2-methyltransferase
MNWSPEQYAKFEQERTRPVADLLAQIKSETVKAAADIGCGPGNSTEILHLHFPQAVITGIDMSPEMIEAARKRLPRIRFEIANIQDWSASGPFDVILASAALHWVPSHELLLPKLVAKLSYGGSLAVQIPDNLDEPVHRIISDIATTGAWAQKLTAASKAGANRHSAEWYFDVLHKIANEVNIWRTIYYHVLPGGATDITEWFKGTALRPYLDLLDTDEVPRFLGGFQHAIAKAYPAMSDGSILLPFPRLFFVATR